MEESNNIPNNQNNNASDNVPENSGSQMESAKLNQPSLGPKEPASTKSSSSDFLCVFAGNSKLPPFATFASVYSLYTMVGSAVSGAILAYVGIDRIIDIMNINKEIQKMNELINSLDISGGSSVSTTSAVFEGIFRTAAPSIVFAGLAILNLVLCLNIKKNASDAQKVQKSVLIILIASAVQLALGAYLLYIGYNSSFLVILSIIVAAVVLALSIRFKLAYKKS